MEKKLRNIEHSGVIEEINNKQILVRIKPRTACGDCKSKSYCGLQDVKDKIIEIETQNSEKYNIGQNVTVTLKESLGYKALLIGYLIPLAILIIVLIFMMIISGNEPISALVTVLVMAVYYVLVYINRQKLRKTFKFHLKY